MHTVLVLRNVLFILIHVTMGLANINLKFMVLRILAIFILTNTGNIVALVWHSPEDIGALRLPNLVSISTKWLKNLDLVKKK